jgi:GTPase SAR1 family protein
MATTFLKRAHGVMVVFDQTTETSCHNTENWLREVERHAKENPFTCIVANKCDLEERNVDEAKLAELCERFKLKFFSTSAKTGENVEKAFMHLITQITEKHFKDIMDGNQDQLAPKGVMLGQKNRNGGRNKKSKSGCCGGGGGGAKGGQDRGKR